MKRSLLGLIAILFTMSANAVSICTSIKTYGVDKGTPNFEIINKSQSNIVVALVQEAIPGVYNFPISQTSSKNFIPLQPKATENRLIKLDPSGVWVLVWEDVTAISKLSISTKNEVTPRPSKIFYIKARNWDKIPIYLTYDNKTLRPQTGQLGGKLGILGIKITESCLSTKENITPESIVQVPGFMKAQ
ncbi:hypothetical protein M1446_02415 [Candidatus Dependentiae bacterium]|nr:hypothetical protein [Candidatus Dependentiae bacterium]